MYEWIVAGAVARPARDLLHIAQMCDASDRSMTAVGAPGATLVAAYSYTYPASWRFS